MWYGIAEQTATKDYISIPRMLPSLYSNYGDAENFILTHPCNDTKFTIVEVKLEVAHGFGMQGGGPT